MRNQNAESLRFPRVKIIYSGLVGPKARPKGVVDGQQVNIPVPPKTRYQPIERRRGVSLPSVELEGPTRCKPGSGIQILRLMEN